MLSSNLYYLSSLIEIPNSVCIFWFNSVVNQFYQTRVIDEYVLLGNSIVLKCLVPSFVADFVQIIGWIDDSGDNIGITIDKQPGIQV